MTEFNKYFEENFIVEEGYNGKEIDKDFRFDENNRHATSRKEIQNQKNHRWKRSL